MVKEITKQIELEAYEFIRKLTENVNFTKNPMVDFIGPLSELQIKKTLIKHEGIKKLLKEKIDTAINKYGQTKKANYLTMGTFIREKCGDYWWSKNLMKHPKFLSNS